MAYSKKLTDLLGYYSLILKGSYFTYSLDWSINLEGCKWAEDNNLVFEGRQFKVDNYKLVVPVYNEKHEPTGGYQQTIAPDLLLAVASVNLKDPKINLVLPKGISSRLVRSVLGKLANAEISDDVTVFSKEIAANNKRLTDFVEDYIDRTSDMSVPFRVAGDGIYTVDDIYEFDDFALGLSPDLKETLMPEESVTKYNVLGLVSAIADLLAKNQPLWNSGGSNDSN